MENQLLIIEQNIQRISHEIEQAAAASGRNPHDIQVMAVTKTQSPALVNAAIQGGIRLLGENRAQELCAKYEDYHRENVEIHFIGALQTNKVRQIVDKVSMIHSVNSLRLAQEIERRCAALDKVMQVLIEVNVGEEAAKAGIQTDEVESLAREIAQMPHLSLKGLMAIPPICDTDAEIERYFAYMHQLQVDMSEKNIDNVSMDVLSMGMSGDYPAAIKHGATIVRLGSTLFGARVYP